MELCQIGANQGLTAEIGWNYTPQGRRCRKILIGLVVRGAKTVVVRGKNRILTQNRKNPEMTVPISHLKEKPLAPLQSPCRWLLVAFDLPTVGAASFSGIPLGSAFRQLR